MLYVQSHGRSFSKGWVSEVATADGDVLMTSQTEFAVDDGAPDPERMREYEVDLTPEPVVRQGLEWVTEWSPPGRFFDPSAGEGVFGKVVGEMFPGDVYRFGVEPRVECIRSLSSNYENWVSMELEGFLDVSGVLGYSLIATNPPFSLALKWVPILRKLLEPGGHLMFLQLTELGQCGEANGELFEGDLPIYQLRIPGAISFRGPGKGSDMRNYSWWIWGSYDDLPPHERWETLQLPRLPSADRKWKTLPGRVS